ncbi:MAG TPA: DNA mismatch repair protein MutS [Chlamydiales bacterium]|nr:DNA mismatch repair protein MutS [Chlamydiales bacterium]
MTTTPTMTPMMAQWHECKAQAKDALLFFRLGDFYEAFYQDAEIMAKHLGLTLTARQGTPMCGVPYHTADSYLDKLVALGFKIAVAEQIGDPEASKGIVKREISRIVTPGTLINSQLLIDNKNNYFVSLVQIGSTFGLSILDLSTGQFTSIEMEDIQDVLNELFRLRPAEFLVGKKFQEDHPAFFKELKLSFSFLINQKEPLDLRFSTDVLVCHFQVHNLDSFGFRGKNASIIAGGSLLLYLKEEMNINCDHILTISLESLSQYMSIDRSSMRNLELTETMSDGTDKNTLLDILDHTCTPMGGRLLRHWIKHPLLSVQEIHERQNAIAHYLKESEQAKTLRKALSKVRDLERLTMKVGTRYATPRDILSLGLSLVAASEVLPETQELRPTFENIIRALNENPPMRLSDGDVFKDSYDPELNQLRKLARESTNYLVNYQNTLREQTGIKTLKVGYTRAFGYYIEVSRGQSEKIPANFQRRQTLVNGERFITEELKAFEHQVLSAEERSKALEADLFEELRISCAKEALKIHQIAQKIAKLDCILSCAWVAFEKNLTRPIVDDSNMLDIKGGRHLIVEHMVGPNSFIANDTNLNEQEQMMLITGPNMAGKSTYIRQVALIAILAQMGSFVPAISVRMGIIDKVFSRIGASDDLARGQSTFMVEMTETANILKNATSRSLVLLDEIGRGTSTYDGISIAWAVAEYLLTTAKKQAKTLFATHYWELTRLEQHFPNAANFQIAVQEIPSGIVFLRKIIRGGTDKSYGIHVARLAGLPAKAIRRAEEMLKELEKQGKMKKEEQLFLFGPPAFLNELQSIILNELTPVEALEKISSWQKQM